MRKIHVLGTPMQIIPPKKAVDRFGHYSPREQFNRVDRDLFRGVDPSGWGRVPADFGPPGYRIGICQISRTGDPIAQARTIVEYAYNWGGVVDAHLHSHFAVSSAFMARLQRQFASRTTGQGEGPISTYPSFIYGVPVIELPIELPLILAAPADQWMVIGQER